MSAFLHLLIAFTWLFLSKDPTLPSFIIGLVVGWFILWALRPLMGEDNYFQRLNRIFIFLWFFCKAFTQSQIDVAATILFPKKHPVHSGFFNLSIEGLKEWEIILLSHSISLTPGTTSVELSDDKSFLVIHALDARDVDATRDDIVQNLMNPIKRITR